MIDAVNPYNNFKIKLGAIIWRDLRTTAGQRKYSSGGHAEVLSKIEASQLDRPTTLSGLKQTG